MKPTDIVTQLFSSWRHTDQKFGIVSKVLPPSEISSALCAPYLLMGLKLGIMYPDKARQVYREVISRMRDNDDGVTQEWSDAGIITIIESWGS